MSKRYHLFQGYGIELEYMIVDRTSLKVRPISDRLLKEVLGEYANDYENGKITWSNELVLHVIEVKTTLPEANLVEMNGLFHENIKKINQILGETSNAMLLPSAMHPFMDPMAETKLWPHDFNAVYETYNRMFNCKGHGWSNVQSTHINFPFYDDEEFSQLHDAIRLVLPLIPALAAASPIAEGKLAEHKDQRLAFYKLNQARIPVIAGHIIPELVHSKRQYHQQIYNEIKAAIEPFDTEKVLDPVWVNSRGAIARFDRGSIEIRLIDIQECAKADLAISSFVIELVKWLDRNRVSGHSLKAAQLAKVLTKTIKDAQKAEINDLEYLDCFGLTSAATAGEVLKHLFQQVQKNIPTDFHESIEFILKEGTLSERILKALNGKTDRGSIEMIYRELAECLAENEMFRGVKGAL
ncbi:MAG: carboxylate-amine ligase [Candidatus Cyclobacteriaceae bacterium M2_1C_046]